MKISKLFLNNKLTFCGLINVVTTDISLNQSNLKEKKIFKNIEQYIYEKNGLTVTVDFIDNDNCLIRKDRIINNSDKNFSILKAYSMFSFPGNNFSVYTQRNSWQNENIGCWQNINTEISSENFGTRSCAGASPVLSIKDNFSSHIFNFNLIPNCRWKMQAKVVPIDGVVLATVLEMGISDDSLCFNLAKGQSIDLPEIIINESYNEIDFDFYRIQDKWLKENDKRSLPIIYNSWLYNFDGINFEKLEMQAKECSKLGFEYFVVDAGWFGEELNWDLTVGDWEENPKGALRGRLKELSDLVHDLKMKFGLWMEPQRANVNSISYKNHPEYYFDADEENKLLDFSKEQARDYIFEKTCFLIDKYNLDFMKFDYNKTGFYDNKNSAFYEYFLGQKLFFKEVRKKYPNLYISFCASGGQHLDLGTFDCCDSFWFSDNQGPIDGIRLYKDFIKRVPSFAIEKWLVPGICKNVPIYTKLEPKDTVVYCNNATWMSIARVSDEYAFSFLKGGPVGFSCDIASLPKEYKDKIGCFIKHYKKERNFYNNALVKILCEDENLIILEYFNDKFTKVIIQVFTKKILQDNLYIYPVLDEKKYYKINEVKCLGKNIMKDGILLNGIIQNNCLEIELLNEG